MPVTERAVEGFLWAEGVRDERERVDGADVMHLMRHWRTASWQRLVARFGQYSRVCSPTSRCSPSYTRRESTAFPRRCSRAHGTLRRKLAAGQNGAEASARGHSSRRTVYDRHVSMVYRCPDSAARKHVGRGCHFLDVAIEERGLSWEPPGASAPPAGRRGIFNSWWLRMLQLTSHGAARHCSVVLSVPLPRRRCSRRPSTRRQNPGTSKVDRSPAITSAGKVRAVRAQATPSWGDHANGDDASKRRSRTGRSAIDETLVSYTV